MATSDGDLSATMLGGSDGIYDFFCDPCSADGEHLEAAGFCKTCAVYLCTGCYKAHRRSPTSRSHKLLDAATMPRTTIRSKPRDLLTQPCDRHQDKLFEYYCSADGDLCCTVCLNMQHTYCNARAYIPDISAGIATSKEYKDIATGMDGLVAMATDETESIVHDEKDNDTYRIRAVANIKSGRKEMDKLLDDAEARAIHRVDELHKQNAEKLNSDLQKCQYVLSEATTRATDLDDKARTGKNNQLFVEVKMAGRRLPAMQEDINQLKARHVSYYKFENDNIVHHFVSTLSAMFSVTVYGDGTKALPVGDLEVKTTDDRNDCVINGIVALSGDRLVVIDCENNAVKLVDVKLRKATSHLGVSSPPCDVTIIRPDQVAVALNKEHKIEIMTVTDTLARTKTITVTGTGNSSISYDGDGFILLSQTARSIKKVDMTGRIVSIVFTDSDSNPLFKKPRFITLDRVRDVVYVIDPKEDTVTCMTLKGRVIWVYKHAELKYPNGIAVGRGGDIMVSCHDTYAVQLLSRSGQLVQVLLDRHRGLAQFPMAIAVFEDNLWVSSNSIKPEQRNYVRMFQLQ